MPVKSTTTTQEQTDFIYQNHHKKVNPKTILMKSTFKKPRGSLQPFKPNMSALDMNITNEDEMRLTDPVDEREIYESLYDPA